MASAAFVANTLKTTRSILFAKAFHFSPQSAKKGRLPSSMRFFFETCCSVRCPQRISCHTVETLR